MARTDFIRIARDHARSRLSAGTQRLYLLDLERWLEWCDAHRCNPAAPRLAKVTAFRDELLRCQKPLSVRRVLSALSAMYEAAVSDEKPAATWNPFKRLPRPRASDYVATEAISKETYERLIHFIVFQEQPSFYRERDAAIVVLLWETGLRVSSVISIERGRLIDREGKIVAKDVFLKGGKRGEIEIPPAAKESLYRWLDRAPKSKWLFCTEEGRKLGEKAITKRVALHARLAGCGHVHPHQFRAAYITAALDAGLSLHDVQASVHHEDPATTLRYDRKQRGQGVTQAVSEWRQRKP